MLLERLEMENFKSFRGRHDVSFGAKLNCITGANGSGKSNILGEAICFAFGESSCARLRVASMKELHSKPLGKAEGTTTRVTLHLRTRQNEAMVISATMCARTGHRTYKLNNRMTPIKMVKRQLRLQCGINVEVSLWLIQQNFVHKMPSRTPAELASYLCEAAGTKLFFEYREEAYTAIEGFKKSALTIDQNIWRLSEVVRRESALLDTYRQQRENDQRIKRLTDELRETNHHLLISQYQQGQEELDAVMERIGEVSARLTTATKAHDRYCEKVQQLGVLLSALKTEQSQFEGVQLELINLSTTLEGLTSRVAQLKERISSDSSKQQEREREITDLTDRKIQTELAICIAVAGLASMQNLAELYSDAVTREVAAEAFIHLLQQKLLEVENENVKHTEEFFQIKLNEMSMLENALHHNQLSMRKATAIAQEELDRKLGQIQQLRVDCKGWSKDRVDHEKVKLQSKLKCVCEEERVTGNELPRMPVPLQGEGDFGLLRDYFEVDRSQCGELWIRPLGLLLQKALCIRICSDSEVAKRILAANCNRHTFTIWPLKELKRSSRNLEHCLSAVYTAFGRVNVADPLEFISVTDTACPELSDLLKNCLKKALGQWLLVRSDRVGQQVLHKFGIPCVAANLNMHSSGMLSGGFQGESLAFDSFLRLPSLRALRLKVEGELAGMDNIQLKLESLEHIHRECLKLRSSIRQNESDIDHIQTRLLELGRQRERIKHEQSALKNTEVRKVIFKKILDKYLSVVIESGKVVDPNERVYQDQHARHLQAQVREYQAELADLEAEQAKLEAQFEQSADNQRACAGQLQQLQDQVHSMSEKVAECKIRDSHATAQMALASEHTTTLTSAKESIRVLFEEIKSLKHSHRDLELRKREVEESLQSLELDLNARSEGNSQVATFEMRNDSVLDLETQAKNLKEQLDSCKLKQRAYDEVTSKNPKVSEEAVLFRQRQLARFQDQDQTLKMSIKNLEEGIETTQQRSAQANEIAFAQVNRSLGDIFSCVAPGKGVELSAIGPNIEDGVKFDVRSSCNKSDKHQAKATKELSGGQLAILGMSYVFALARYSASPMYILDEIDAALDEHNQRRVAELVLEHFNQSQVICISHHEAFHTRASRLIQVQKHDTTSVITTRTPRG